MKKHWETAKAVARVFWESVRDREMRRDIRDTVIMFALMGWHALKCDTQVFLLRIRGRKEQADVLAEQQALEFRQALGVPELNDPGY